MNKRILILILTLVFASVLIGPAYSNGKTRIAILDFTSENTETTYAKAVRNIFEVSLYKTDIFDILERNQMETILKEQGFQMSGCIDTSCAIKIGKILSADMVIIGTLNKLGKFTITIKFVNVGQGRIKLADSETADAEDDIRNAVKILSKRMADNYSMKSGDTNISSIKTNGIKNQERINLIIYGAYLLPRNKFSELVDAGKGVTAEFIFENIFTNNFLFGLGIGLWSFPGAKDNIDYCTIIPAYLNFGYRFPVFNEFQLVPKICGGIGYNSMKWDKNNTSADNYKFEKENMIEPLAKAGLNLIYNFHEDFSLEIGMDYCFIFEKKLLGFLSFYAGLALKL